MCDLLCEMFGTVTSQTSMRHPFLHGYLCYGRRLDWIKQQHLVTSFYGLTFKLQNLEPAGPL